MRVPGVRLGIAIYIAALTLATAWDLADIALVGSTWRFVAASMPAMLTPVALFVAAFSINDRWAFGLPVLGLLAQTTVELLASDPPEGFAMLTYREELWEMIRFELPVALLIVAAALFLAQKWAPRVAEGRIDRPSVNGPAIAFPVALLLSLVTEVATLRLEFMHGAWAHVFQLGVFAALTISFFVLCVTAYSPWVLPLPIFLATEALIAIVLSPAFTCSAGICGDIIWPALKNVFLTWSVMLLVSLAAGWWSHRSPPADTVS